MSTTLTREAFFQKTKPRVETVDVEGFGQVMIKSVKPSVKSRRDATLMDSEGNLIDGYITSNQLFAIVDQVMVSENEPMFTDDDLPELREVDYHKLEPLIAAVARFNAPDEKKPVAGSKDSGDT